MSKTPEEMAIRYSDLREFTDRRLDYKAKMLLEQGFLAGYKAAQDQVADVSKVMLQWISVSDRLPENDREVLVVLNGESYKDVHVSWHDGEEFGWATTGYVSHWMELPAPPKEEK
jgi:hypothetical protein